jgi:hypothetical protein
LSALSHQRDIGQKGEAFFKCWALALAQDRWLRIIIVLLINIADLPPEDPTAFVGSCNCCGDMGISAS